MSKNIIWNFFQYNFWLIGSPVSCKPEHTMYPSLQEYEDSFQTNEIIRKHYFTYTGNLLNKLEIMPACGTDVHPVLQRCHMSASILGI